MILSKVCGEPCNEQQCIECMSKSQKANVADLILGTTLGELDLTASTMDHRTISLRCGHVFTVETLDGHCHMQSFYEFEHNPLTDAIRYLDVKAPPIDFQTPPSCPTCRRPITARRYGRVVKRANLDILERNVASTMSKSLSAATEDLGPVTAQMATLEEDAKKMAFYAVSKSKEELDGILASWTTDLANLKLDDSVVPITLTAPNLARGFSKEEVSAWSKLVYPLTRCFKAVAKVASKKGPHVQTYQAALATLYRIELDAIVRRGESTRPEPDAMKQVDKKMGQPPHKADTRFQVEAIIVAVDIRLQIAKVGNARYEKYDQEWGDAEKGLNRQLWGAFVRLLYEASVVDAKTALKVATNSSASKQVARCEVLVMRTETERFRFEIMVDRSELLYKGNYWGPEREDLVKKIRTAKASMELLLKQSRTRYIHSRGNHDLVEWRKDATWFQDNYGSKAEKYIQEYEDLATYISDNKVYQPLSTREMEDIVKAFNFGTFLIFIGHTLSR